ncbi:MAG: hypothetical protein CK427_16525 [Leptospira sp.]|nr:MAG: hypothetical protein CK427_16525 [Leptospira sp.]
MKEFITYLILGWDLIYGIQFCGDNINLRNSNELNQTLKEKIKSSDFIGMTESEILEKFGRKYNDRLTFDPPMPKLLFGREVLVTRLILYSFINGINEDYGNIKVSYSDEKIFLTFYFYNGKVVIYDLDHNYYDPEIGKDVFGELDRYSGVYDYNMRKFWTDALCDLMYYERIVKKIHFPNKSWRIKYWENKQCYWESDEDYAKRDFGRQENTKFPN